MLRDVGVTFEGDEGDTEAVRSVSLDIQPGEFVAIVGPSGCGKSTILNAIAGLRKPSHGEVLYRGRPVGRPNGCMGYVTQQDNLLPWRTVERNIALALEIRHAPPAQQREAVEQMIGLVGLRGFERYYPSELSGGMRKRVTLARTLVYQPEVLLLDEPFGALDAQLKLILQGELLRIWSQLKCTIAFVTHDLEEAIMLADRVVVFSARPSRVKLIRTIPLPRPRMVEELRFTDQFGELYTELWRVLREDLLEGEAI